MISHRIVRMIEARAHALTQQWMAAVKRSQKMPVFLKVDPAVLYDHCFQVYSQLGHWLDHSTSTEELIEFFTDFGRQRFYDSIPLSQVIQAITLHRRVLYLFMDERGLIGDDAFALQQAMELTNRVLVFYDRAAYYTSYGFEQAGAESISGLRDCEHGCQAMEKARAAFDHVTPWEILRRGLSDAP